MWFCVQNQLHTLILIDLTFNPEICRELTLEIVADTHLILRITCALPFCFTGPIQLVHCDACSKPQLESQGAAKYPRYSRERRQVHCAQKLRVRYPNFVEHTSHCAQVATKSTATTKWQRRGSYLLNQMQYRYWFLVLVLMINIRIDWNVWRLVIYVYIQSCHDYITHYLCCQISKLKPHDPRCQTDGSAVDWKMSYSYRNLWNLS